MIKALLIIGLASAAVLLFRGKPNATQLALRRAGGTAALLLGVCSVLFPSSVTTVANLLGVGRGTDLVLYVLVIAFLLTSIALYRRVQELEDNYVHLARCIAISEAQQRPACEPHNRPDALSTTQDP